MLTRPERREIEHEGLSTMHDYWFISLFAGEPFLQNEVLVYYDGRVASLCAFPMRNQRVIEAALCYRIACEWVADRGAESIILVGSNRVDFHGLTKVGLRQVCEQKPRSISAELFIDCTDGSHSIFKRRLYKRSRLLPFELSVRRGGLISAEHFRLIEMFYAERRLTGFLAEVLFVLPALLRSSRVTLIEARKEARLVGFAIMHKPFCDTAVGLFMMCNRGVRGVSDFLYAAMLEEARARGATCLNLGPSPSIGHFNFKLKWGGEARVPPYYFVQWTRGKLARRYHTAWGPRILHL